MLRSKNNNLIWNGSGPRLETGHPVIGYVIFLPEGRMRSWVELPVPGLPNISSNSFSKFSSKSSSLLVLESFFFMCKLPGLPQCWRTLYINKSLKLLPSAAKFSALLSESIKNASAREIISIKRDHSIVSIIE